MQEVSINQAKELLSNLGINVQVVESKEDVADVDVSALTEEAEKSIVEQHRSSIENEVRESVISTEAAKLGKMEMNHISKTFGIPRKELADKSFEEMLAMVKEMKDKDVTEESNNFEQRLLEIQAEHEKELSEKDNEIETANKKYIDRDINTSLYGVIETLPRVGGKSDTQARQLKGWLQDKGYELAFDEEKNSLKIMKDGKAATDKGGKELNIDNLAKEWGSEVGVLAKDTSHLSPKEVEQINPNPTQQSGQPVSAIEQWAQGG